MTGIDQFPLRGIIGVVSESLSEIELAVNNELQCVEIRADLLLDKGMSFGDLLLAVEKSRAASLACLVTLRHPGQGGRFTGSEDERVQINRQVLAAGADIIDLEWGTDASKQLLADGAPMILSYHDFGAMPSRAELSSLTEDMLRDEPLAIKIVPTATTLDDAVRMLSWVSEADMADSDPKHTGVRRIGFAMGSAGACSRILTTAFGGPVTYTSFGEPVAPGQIALPDLIRLYRVQQLDKQTTLTAITGAADLMVKATLDLNQQYQRAGENQVAIAFPNIDSVALDAYKSQLRISRFHTVDER